MLHWPSFTSKTWNLYSMTWNRMQLSYKASKMVVSNTRAAKAYDLAFLWRMDFHDTKIRLYPALGTLFSCQWSFVIWTPEMELHRILNYIEFKEPFTFLLALFTEIPLTLILWYSCNKITTSHGSHRHDEMMCAVPHFVPQDSMTCLVFKTCFHHLWAYGARPQPRKSQEPECFVSPAGHRSVRISETLWDPGSVAWSMSWKFLECECWYWFLVGRDGSNKKNQVRKNNLLNRLSDYSDEHSLRTSFFHFLTTLRTVLSV